MSNIKEFPADKVNSQRRKAKQGKHRKIVLLFAIVIFLLLPAGLWLKNKLVQGLVDEVPAQSSVLEETVAATFLILRDEVAVTAPYKGKLEFLGQEGERVAKSTIVCNLLKQEGTALEGSVKIPLQAPQAGTLSYYTDGYENICNPKVWPQLDLQKLGNWRQGLGKLRQGNAKEKDAVEAGQTLFKIIDNLTPSYLYFETGLDFSKPIHKGESLDIHLTEQDNPVLVSTVFDFYTIDNRLRILLKIPNVTEIEKARTIQGTIVTNKYTGVVVADSVLSSRNGVPGVYLMKGGQATWHKVTVIGQVQHKVALGGLEATDWIITTPYLVQDGQRVFSLRH